MLTETRHSEKLYSFLSKNNNKTEKLPAALKASVGVI